MNYKKTFLSLLLVPLAVIGDTTNMKQLEKKLLQKELELSNLGTLIAEKDKMLASFELEIQYIFTAVIDKKVQQLEEKSSKPLSREEREKLAKELQNTALEFVRVFCADYQNQKAVSGILSKGLIQVDSNGDFLEFESLKFYLIRCAFERPLLRHLIAEYEHCLQELRAIQNEITALNVR